VNIVRKNVEIGGHSLEELTAYRNEFGAELKKNRAFVRRFALPILAAFISGFIAIICSLLFCHPPALWLFVTGFILIAIGLVIMAVAATLFHRTLICPSCNHDFIDDIHECCPECGSHGVEWRKYYGERYCPGCKKSLVTGRNRNFKYRACTHCGVMLNTKGL
jgi:hypothetical protein